MMLNFVQIYVQIMDFQSLIVSSSLTSCKVYHLEIEFISMYTYLCVHIYLYVHMSQEK